MTEPRPSQDHEEPVPKLQQLYDSPFLLLVAGLIVMFVLYTGWGMLEIMRLPQATLP